MVCLNPHKVTSVVAPVPENVQLRAVQLYSGSQAKSFFLGEARNKLCVTNSPNGSFLSSEIGEIG